MITHFTVLSLTVSAIDNIDPKNEIWVCFSVGLGVDSIYIIELFNKSIVNTVQWLRVRKVSFRVNSKFLRIALNERF